MKRLLAALTLALLVSLVVAFLDGVVQRGGALVTPLPYTRGVARMRRVHLTQRLDLVLFRNTLSVTPNLCGLDADVVGDELSDHTPSGLWPCDHAGVVATLRAE